MHAEGFWFGANGMVQGFGLGFRTWHVRLKIKLNSEWQADIGVLMQ